jgi:negative regulator of genetic competence, sporulation and motility
MKSILASNDIIDDIKQMFVYVEDIFVTQTCSHALFIAMLTEARTEDSFMKKTQNEVNGKRTDTVTE